MSRITFNVRNVSTTENRQFKIKSVNDSLLTIPFAQDMLHEVYLPNQKYAVCLSPYISVVEQEPLN